MKTAKEYASEYREIARNLGMKGDSTEMLVQMLAHFTYTNEVESIAYSNEASLERALLVNSKIQHCAEIMYSVFRGRCPRVILRFRPTKFFELGVYDRLVSTNSFSLYYLGYLEGSPGKIATGLYDASLGEMGGLKFTYAPTIIQPSEYGYVTILCMLSKDSVETTGTLDAENLYYIDVKDSDLSQDIWVKISEINTGSLSYIDVTREFQTHLLDNFIFDLTLPDWGSRLYIPEEYRKENTKIEAMSFKYLTIDSLNSHDIRNIRLDGAEPVGIHDTETDIDFMDSLEEISKGVILIPELPRESMGAAHYKANQDRFMGSILRSNTDVGGLLKEMYPEKVKSTTYHFNAVREASKVEVVNNSGIPDSDLVLKPTIIKYVGSQDINVDLTIDLDSFQELSIPISKTNEETPFTTTYSIRSESPISTLSSGNVMYVIKSYLDEDGDLVDRVIQPEDLESKKLALQYRYGSDDKWKSLTQRMIPERPCKVLSEGSTESSKSTSKSTEVTTGPENELIQEKITQSSSEVIYNSTEETKTEDPEFTGPLEVRLIDKSVISCPEVDHEYLPYITEDTTYFGVTDREYVIPVSGNLKVLCEFPIEIPTIFYLSGRPVQAETYEVLCSSKELKTEITSSGLVRILGITESIGDFTAVYRANLEGIGYTTTLHVKTTATKNSQARILDLYYKYSVGVYGKISEYRVWSGDIITIDKAKLISLLPSGSTGKVTLGFNCKENLKLLSEKVLSDNLRTVSTSPEFVAVSVREKESSLVALSEIVESETAKTYKSINEVPDTIKRTSKTAKSSVLRINQTPSERLTMNTLIARPEILTNSSEINRSAYIKVTETTQIDQVRSGVLGSLGTVTSVTAVAKETEFVPEIILGPVTIKSLTTIEEEVTDKPSLTIYYVPQNSSDLLDDLEKDEFIKKRSSYYITDNIDIQRGTLINAIIDLRVYLYQNDSIEKSIMEILEKYKYNFGLSVNDGALEDEIKSQVSKIPNIARITNLSISYKTESGDLMSVEEVQEIINHSYFEFTTYITSNLFTTI